MRLLIIVGSFLLIIVACRRDSGDIIDKTLRHTLKSAKVEVLKPAKPHDSKVVELGQKLMFDKILSGKKDISCATCHHPVLHAGDAISLSIGVGGKGLGPTRVLGEGRAFNPRNATEVFSRGLPGFVALNWDGSVSSIDDGLDTFAGVRLPPDLDGPLAAQHLFELASRQSMRGREDDTRAIDGTPNELAKIPDDDFKAIWHANLARLVGDPPGEGGIPEYIELFKAAYPDVPLEQLGIQHAVNAIAAWEIDTWTHTKSPFDRYLAGDNNSMSKAQKRGALLFYGKARCYECHSGGLLSDMGYHNIAAPQIGPGVGKKAPLDLGRGRITDKPEDNFKFRTPPLRNVALTGPWMHSGAYTTLEAAVRHHLDPKKSLEKYDANQLDPRLQEMVHNKDLIGAWVYNNLDHIVAAPTNLNDQEFSDLMDFLYSFTDPRALGLGSETPDKVPSGLPIYD